MQGCVDRHKPHIEAAGGFFVAVKTAEQLESVDALILPGGESTTMLKLIDVFAMEDPLKKFFAQKPVWGICAGSILMAEKVLVSSSPRRALASLDSGDPEKDGSEAADVVDPVRANAANAACQRDDGGGTQKSFGLLPITIERNGYGRQLDSKQVTIDGFEVSFIRAPVIKAVNDNVEVLAEYEGTPVWLRSGKYMATTFHPELTLEYPSPMHRAFVEMVKQAC